ncbi:hypothetical protein [Cyanobacterium sp. uoEpiScrs1]|uniref:hypothetical protein n=1 Tax=Cyanobacterium sp. uoEpiScrs1 TaxID=2976343 RepID=UPI00226A34F3|nr:hypothetical protein [Cyanobacterium sp. uoEpiScrs1]
MEYSTSSGKVVESPTHRWAYIIGTTIALLTLTLPMFAIAYYSPQNRRAGPETSIENFQPLP